MTYEWYEILAFAAGTGVGTAIITNGFNYWATTEALYNNFKNQTRKDSQIIMNAYESNKRERNPVNKALSKVFLDIGADKAYKGYKEDVFTSNMNSQIREGFRRHVMDKFPINE